MNIFLPSLLPSLGLLFSYVFMWSNNAHMFSNISIAVSFLIILAISLFIWGINYFLIPKCIPIFIQDRWHQSLFYIYIACLFSFIILCIVDYDIFNQRKIYAPILACTLFIVFYIGWSKILTIFMSIMLLFSSIILIKNSIFEEEYIFSQNDYHVTLKNKPNIYLYWLESYQDFDFLNRVYNIDSEEYKRYLYDKRFIIGDNIFSSGSYTLIAFTQLYSCSGSEKIMGNMDVPRAMRELIGGNENNFVFRTLKENGYKTIMLAGSQYYLYKKGQYLDEVDMDLNSFLYPLIQVSFLKKRINEIGNGYYGTLSDRVKTAIKRGKESKKPYIIAFKGGARHTNVSNYTWKERKNWIISNEYQRWVKKSNAESEEIIDFILKKDPEALIVLLGDHGALSYRGFPYDDPTSYEKYNVREEDVFDDVFRVLLAYRLPGGAQDDIAHGLYMNNVNIFTHIFVYLAEDPSLLEQRTPSVSTLGKAKMVEGKLVRE